MHCGKALYNNLLWKNWSVRHLPLVTLIGNSFTGMMDRLVQDAEGGDPSRDWRRAVVMFRCLSSQQNSREGVHAGLQIHYRGAVSVWGETAPLSVPSDRRLQRHCGRHLSQRGPGKTPTIHLGRAAWATVHALLWFRDNSEGNAELMREMKRKWILCHVFWCFFFYEQFSLNKWDMLQKEDKSWRDFHGSLC